MDKMLYFASGAPDGTASTEEIVMFPVAQLSHFEMASATSMRVYFHSNQEQDLSSVDSAHAVLTITSGKHKEVMEKWVSISAKRHLEFEKIIKAKSHHLLDLSKYIFDDGISENIGETDLTDEIIKLKKLLDEGVITQEEFTKAKKKLLN